MNGLLGPEAAFVQLFLFFAIYSILDGYALGIGCMVLFMRDRKTADRLVSHIAPFWEAHEVWLVMAIGFLFAAFPLVYSTAIPAFYLPCMAAIGALMLRATALEFSYHDPNRVRFWRTLMGLGSFLMIFGSAMALGFVLLGFHFMGPGVISGDITAAFTELPLLFGVAGVVFFVWHGILHVRMKNDDASQPEIPPLSRPAAFVWVMALILSVAAALLWLTTMPVVRAKSGFWLGGGVYFGGLLASRLLVGKGAWGFRASALAIAGLWIAVGASLFPNILVSVDRPEWTISAYQAVASNYALHTMLLTAPILMVLIAGYSRFVKQAIRR